MNVPLCDHCDADVFPSGPRQGEGHVGVRFGDVNRGLRVYLDSELVDDVIHEAMAGPKGWVVVAAGTCPRCGHGLWQRVSGDVRIRRESVR